MSSIYPTLSGGKTKHRVYYLYQSQKLYIGLYEDIQIAKKAYAWVHLHMHSSFELCDFPDTLLSFSKFISLLNLKKNNVYFSVPIFILKNAFRYYMTIDTYLTFDLKHLFFISNHRIHRRGQYLYINIGNRQENLLKRFGIPNHATYGVDYYTLNEDRYDFRRENLCILTHYKGVYHEEKYNVPTYVARIYTTQYMVIGHYNSELEAAIAYNKAIDTLCLSESQSHVKNDFPFLTRQEYQSLYNTIAISKRLTHKTPQNRVVSTKGYRGIAKDKSGYRALIGYNKKQIYLGIYPTEKRAAQAYNYASLYLYGGKGYVNPISPLTHPSDQEKIATKLQKSGVLKPQHSHYLKETIAKGTNDS